jgi:rhodanese-related sulfurtransferase
MSRILHLLFALVFSLPLAAEELKHTTDSVGQVKAAVSAGTAIIIDVREQSEWNDGHLKAATLVPLSVLNKEGGEIPAALPKDKPIYLHCRSGGRSLKAGEILKAKGYDARPLAAGYNQLIQDGFEKAP